MRKLKDPSSLKQEMSGKSAEDEDQLSPTTTIEVDKEVNGRHYRGTFIFKVPTLGDMIMIGKMKTAYLPQGAAADPTAATLVEQVCYLEVCLQDPRPSWWKPLEFREADVLTHLYLEAAAYANKFLGRDANGRTTDQSHAATDDASDGADSEGNVEPSLQPSEQRSPVVVHDTAGSR